MEEITTSELSALEFPSYKKLQLKLEDFYLKYKKSALWLCYSTLFSETGPRDRAAAEPCSSVNTSGFLYFHID